MSGARLLLPCQRVMHATRAPPCLQELIPPMIPGFVFGGIALAIFVLFILVPLAALCCRCCRCCVRLRRRKARGASSAGARPVPAPQFIESRSGGPAVVQQQQPEAGRSRRWLAVFRLALLALTLGTIGVAAWGMAEVGGWVCGWPGACL